MIYLETIDAFKLILGVNRPPDAREHLKTIRYNNDSKTFEYITIGDTIIENNTNLNAGIVSKGNDGSPNYVWKLDANKNPSWLPENVDLYLQSVAKSTTDSKAVFTLSDNSKLNLSLGALAWKDTVEFTAGNDYNILFNQNGIIQGNNNFLYDYINNQLKLNDFGGIIVKKTTIDTQFIKILNYLGAGIVELGDNVYIKEAIKVSKYNGSQPLSGMIQYNVDRPQWYNGTEWVDFANNEDTFLNYVAAGSIVDTELQEYRLNFRLNDNTAFAIQLGANAFNSKVILAMSGEVGNVQLAGEDDLDSSNNLKFINDILLLNGIIELTPKDKISFLLNNDGTIFADIDEHFYGMFNGTQKQLDNIDYTAVNLGTGLGLFKSLTTVNSNSRTIDFKSLIAGNNVVLSETETGIQIDATAGVDSGEVNSGYNVGTGIPVYRGKDGVLLKFHRIIGEGDIHAVLDEDTIKIRATGSAANNYIEDVLGATLASDNPIVHPILDVDLGTKDIEFIRHDLASIIIKFGINAFSSENIRNISYVGNVSKVGLITGTTSDNYKLNIVSSKSDGSDETSFTFQLGTNAFNSNNIESLVNATKVWTLETKQLEFNLNYKLDTVHSEDITPLSIFQLKFDESLEYNESTNTLKVSPIVSSYITAITRVPETNYINFAFSDDSNITFTDLGTLAFVNSIPNATSDILGLVKLGQGIVIDENGAISIDAENLNLDIDTSRLVSYDPQGFQSSGDRDAARINILAAYINGDEVEDFTSKSINVFELINAASTGKYDYDDFPNKLPIDFADLEIGFHKIGHTRIAFDTITSIWDNIRLRKGDSYVNVGANAIDFIVGEDGSIFWYAMQSGVKTKVMALLPRNDVDAGLVYDLHVSGQIVQFSNSL